MFLGPEDFSGNILVSESYNFFYCISFCQFSNFKNLSSPELALFQGAFSQNFGILSCVTKVFLPKLFTFEVFETFTFSKHFENFSKCHTRVTKF